MSMTVLSFQLSGSVFIGYHFQGNDQENAPTRPIRLPYPLCMKSPTVLVFSFSLGFPALLQHGQRSVCSPHAESLACVSSLVPLCATWSTWFVAFEEQKTQTCWVWGQSAVIAA